MKSSGAEVQPKVFVRSGRIFLDYGYLRSSGIDGHVWSRVSTIYSSATSAMAYYLNFYAFSINLSDDPTNRYRGFPVRCLVY